jgi:hypothetical protein
MKTSKNIDANIGADRRSTIDELHQQCPWLREQAGDF